MKLSIAMATYNGAKYLPEQLQSFIDQIRQPDELVISDDVSTDSTLEIVKEFTRTAPFEVRFFQNEHNLGYAGNFNTALMQTTGDLVLLSDQDDVWFPEKILRLEEIAEVYPDKLLFMNDAALTDSGLNELGFTKLGQIHSAGLNDHSFVMGCCCAIRRELLDLCMPIPAGYKAHDNWIVGFAEGLDAKVISERVLQYYRRHGKNESQFFVNQTTKVTRLVRYKELLCRYWPLSPDIEELRLEQKRFQAEGIMRALSRDKGRYGRQLQTMEAEGRAYIGMMEKRLSIRRKHLSARLIASLWYWMDGGYRSARGLKSVFRDLMG